MRIPTNSASNSTIDLLQRLSAQQSSLQARVSTGQRIEMPSDDPSSVGRVLELEGERRLALQFEENTDFALGVSQVSFSGLNEIRSVSDRATELAALANGSVGSTQMSAYGDELNQLIEHAIQLANTRFGNAYIYGGTAVDTPPFVADLDTDGNTIGVSYVGNSERAGIAVGSRSLITPGTSGETNEDIAEFIGRLVELRDAMYTGDVDAVSTLRQGLDESEDNILAGLGELGAIQLRIEASHTQQTVWKDNIERVVSSEADIDLADAMVQLSQASVAYEAALSSSSRILQLSILDYLR